MPSIQQNANSNGLLDCMDRFDLLMGSRDGELRYSFLNINKST